MADNKNLNQYIMLQNSVSFLCLEMNVFSFKKYSLFRCMGSIVFLLEVYLPSIGSYFR